MKVYQTNEIKNIALLGNDGSGKTTLTEALLFESGIIKRCGSCCHTWMHVASASLTFSSCFLEYIHPARLSPL